MNLNVNRVNLNQGNEVRHNLAVEIERKNVFWAYIGKRLGHIHNGMISLKGIFLKIHTLELATKLQAEEGYGREQQKFWTRRENSLKQSFARRLKTDQFTKLALVGIQWCMQYTSILRSDQHQQQRLEVCVCVCVEIEQFITTAAYYVSP